MEAVLLGLKKFYKGLVSGCLMKAIARWSPSLGKTTPC